LFNNTAGLFNKPAGLFKWPAFADPILNPCHNLASALKGSTMNKLVSRFASTLTYGRVLAFATVFIVSMSALSLTHALSDGEIDGAKAKVMITTA
jgi:hypothetical protein